MTIRLTAVLGAITLAASFALSGAVQAQEQKPAEAAAAAAPAAEAVAAAPAAPAPAPAESVSKETVDNPYGLTRSFRRSTPRRSST